jgi:(E)-4-hydroxy-3-methylbut-2-enyl-diphosphate synthase
VNISLGNPPERRRTRAVQVGAVTIGGQAPVSVQSMTTTATEDVDATLAQIGELAALGCEIVRCAAPNRRAARALAQICPASPIPVVADIHYDHGLALIALDGGAHGVRVNPGNMKDAAGVAEVYRAAAAAGAKVRIGVNSGSIRPRDGLNVADAAEPMAEVMVRAALNYAEAAEAEGLTSIVLSLKASDVPTTIAACRLAAGRCDYPMHVGVTAAGPPRVSVVRSSVGIGTLLAEGIGDTIRVSMTGPPHEEVRVGHAILEALHLRQPRGVQIVACPTCGRCEIDLAALTDEVERRTAHLAVPLRVAVMGCVVNGPGEAAECDVGVAGGRDFGYLFRRGTKLRKLEAAELADALVAEVERLARE